MAMSNRRDGGMADESAHCMAECLRGKKDVPCSPVSSLSTALAGSLCIGGEAMSTAPSLFMKLKGSAGAKDSDMNGCESGLGSRGSERIGCERKSSRNGSCGSHASVVPAGSGVSEVVV